MTTNRQAVFLAAFIPAFGIILGISQSNASPRGWLRLVVDADQFKGMPGVSIAIASVSYQDYQLSATAWYRYVQGRDPVTLHGSRDPDGSFRPTVTYEVAIEDKKRWRKLSFRDDAKSSVVVSPEQPILRLGIDMEPFRSCIGTYRYGRVVLENEDAAIIDLEDLLPTADAREDAAGSFKEDVSDGDMRMRQRGFKDPAPDALAHLTSVTSLGKRLIGDFIVDNRSEKIIRIVGSKTLDGDFWPRVEFFAGSPPNWKALGKSKNNGIAATLEIPTGKAQIVRVLLTDYKALIGQHTCGKIVFPDGESGVFYLELLDPQN